MDMKEALRAYECLSGKVKLFKLDGYEWNFMKDRKAFVERNGRVVTWPCHDLNIRSVDKYLGN